MYVELYNNPPVRRLITLATPNAGIYCDDTAPCNLEGLPKYSKLIEDIVYSDKI